jgi:hypothetical protein
MKMGSFSDSRTSPTTCFYVSKSSYQVDLPPAEARFDSWTIEDSLTDAHFDSWTIEDSLTEARFDS